MKVELRLRLVKMPKKTYDYLYVPVSKDIIETMRPRLAIVTVDEKYPPITLKIKRFSDGNGYAVIPREVVKYLNLKPGQVVNLDFKF
ncbi:MAG: hypothetical protein QW764_02940 [Desulfurococcaceae archaeon]